jgi:hypothetical protein
MTYFIAPEIHILSKKNLCLLQKNALKIVFLKQYHQVYIFYLLML